MQVMQDDGPILVEFYIQAVPDRSASQKSGHAVYRDEEYVRITPPGGNHVWEGAVTETHKRRFERQYDAWKKGLEPPVDGTPLKEWPPITPGQMHTLTGLHIRTVEALAKCPDQVLQRAGMGAYALRDKARAWLESAENHGQVAEEVSALRVENQALKDRLEQLEAAVAANKPKRGRPPKNREEAA